MGTSTACSLGSARHRHISAPALPTRSVFVWAGGEGRLPGARLSGWQSARAGSMGAPCRGRHRMREQSLPACSMGLAGREVENWKGPELTPLCATTGAGQLRSPPCSAGGGGVGSVGMEKDFPHLSAFAMPRKRPSLGRHLGKEMVGACPMQNSLPQSSCITNTDGYRAASWGQP